MRKYKELAISATVIGFSSFVIFVYNIHKSKNANRLPYLWLFLITTGQLLSLAYGILNNMPEVYIPSSLVTLGLMDVLYIKIQYAEEAAIEEDLIKKNIINE